MSQQFIRSFQNGIWRACRSSVTVTIAARSLGSRPYASERILSCAVSNPAGSSRRICRHAMSRPDSRRPPELCWCGEIEVDEGRWSAVLEHHVVRTRIIVKHHLMCASEAASPSGVVKRSEQHAIWPVGEAFEFRRHPSGDIAEHVATEIARRTCLTDALKMQQKPVLKWRRRVDTACVPCRPREPPQRHGVYRLAGFHRVNRRVCLSWSLFILIHRCRAS
ncbi:hypothetical protein SAMN05443245_3834 [Paraburkholderia fungorum]|uniref:Uncharacterized protein n=1 Tax=Paraburkholderia fungorum TaxID=134537 RepID=A0A1H1HF22_9BURK|nr:hypothetical protein SAMN05443245_3834 [Paraburkholderia fungorum]